MGVKLTQTKLGGGRTMRQVNWVPISGRFEVSDGTITYLGEPSKTATPGDFTIGVIRSDIEFEKGVIELECKLTDPEARAQVIIPGASGSDLFVGINLLGAPYGFAAFRENSPWEPKGGAGYGAPLPVEQWIRLRVAIDGASVSLYVNDVNVVSTTHQTVRGQLGLFFAGNTQTQVRSVRVKTEQPICFVVMQFTEEFDALYQEVIKPCCERFDYRVIRADEFHASNMIIDDITRSLRESALVIADITPDNPNVFYEVGYAHALETPTILLKDRSGGRLPFDVSGFRTIFYDNTIAGKSGVEAALERHLSALGDRWKLSRKKQ